MANAIFDSSIAWEPVTRRGIPGQIAKVTDATTDLPIDGLLDLEGNPLAALVSNSQGYVQPFQIAEGPALVKVTVGPVTYVRMDLTRISISTAAAEAAAEAAERAAQLVQAPADEIVAMLAQNPVSSTYGALDATTGSLVGQDGSATQIAGDARWFTEPAGDARYTKRGELEVIVTDYGPIGEGTDAATIQAAIDDAAGAFYLKGGKTVVFPPLTYDVLDRVRLRSGLRYRAYGATFTKSSVANGYAVFYSRSDGTKGYGSGDSEMNWEGGTFQGDLANNIGICAFALHHTDSMEVSKTAYLQCAYQGHIFDLLGCSNIEIHHSVFAGFKNFGGNYAREEAIQCDISAAGTSSAIDSPGSYDGIACKHINVHHNQFLPLTVGATTYPAPNPLGSHTLHESATSTDISFDDNLVVDTNVDITSDIRGIIHFAGLQGASFQRNTVRFSTPVNTTLLGLYSTDYGVPSAGANFEEGAVNTIGTMPNPLIIDDVTIRGNKFEGFSNVNQQNIVHIVPDARGGNIYAGTVRILGNQFTMKNTGSSATNFVVGRYIHNLVIDEMNIFDGPGRPVDVQNVDVLVLGKNKSTGARADAWRAAFCGSVKADGISALSCAGTALYVASCTDLQVSGINKLHSLAGTRAFGVTACTRFTVTGALVTAPSGTKGIEVYGGSAYGFVDKNIINGGTTTHVDISTVTANQVSESGNLKLTT